MEWVDIEGGVSLSGVKELYPTEGSHSAIPCIFFLSEVIRGVMLLQVTTLKGVKDLSPDARCVFPSSPFKRIQNLDRAYCVMLKCSHVVL